MPYLLFFVLIFCSITRLYGADIDSLSAAYLCAPRIYEDTIIKPAFPKGVLSGNPRTYLPSIDTPRKESVRGKYVFHSINEGKLAQSTEDTARGFRTFLIIFWILAGIPIFALLLSRDEGGWIPAWFIALLLFAFATLVSLPILALTLLLFGKARRQKKIAASRLMRRSDRRYKPYQTYFDIGSIIIFLSYFSPLLLLIKSVPTLIVLGFLAPFGLITGLVLYWIGIGKMQRFWGLTE